MLGQAQRSIAQKSSEHTTICDAATDSRNDAVIRVARDKDADGLITLIRAIYEEYPGCIFDLEHELPELKKPASFFARAGGRLWVAECGGAVVASCGFLPADKPQGLELHKVYLRRDHRGSGLAARMFDTALAAAQAQGALFIELWTDTRFRAAHRFYEKLGFIRSPGERLLDDLSRSSEYHYLRPLAVV